MGDEKAFVIPKLAQNLLNLELSSCLPLSDTKVCGMLNMHIVAFHTKCVVFCSVILVSGSTSTHFVK